MNIYEKKYKETLERAKTLYENANGMILKKWVEQVFPELAESEDERMRKDCIKYLDWEYQHCSVNEDKMKIEKCIAWLEKQGSPVLSNSSNIGKSAQKPTDKVEPRFKVGDWVVTGYGKVNQVVTVDKDGDGFTLDDGTYFSGSWKDGYHLWTIQDAKDGDVLVVPYIEGTTSCEKVFIFKEIKGRGYNKNVVEYYCSFANDKFKINEGLHHFMGHEDDCFTPATKEQRDLLFVKMKEAGYKWDEEKKELKRIEHTPAWTEEDEVGLGDALWAIEQAKTTVKNENEMGNLWYAERWLKALKQRIGG